MYRILAVDYANLFYKCYWSTKNKNVPGLDVYRFMQLLYIAMRQTMCNTIIFAGESYSKLRRTYLDSSYKTDRKPPESDKCKAFKNCLFNILKALRINILHYSGFEGDDIIASLCSLAKFDKVFILSADKDLMQLLDLNRVFIVYPEVYKTVYDEESFYIDYGFLPCKYPIFKALVGDKSGFVEKDSGIAFMEAKDLVKNDVDICDIFSRDEYDKFNKRLQLLSLEDTVPSKVFTNSYHLDLCSKKRYKVVKKIFHKFYGSELEDGVINEIKKIYSLNTLRDKNIVIHMDSIIAFGTIKNLDFKYLALQQRLGAKIIFYTRKLESYMVDSILKYDKYGLTCDLICDVKDYQNSLKIDEIWNDKGVIE